MLTGQLPFVAESPVAVSLKHIQSTPPNPRSLNSSIPQIIEDVILKAMAKDPAHRYQSARELSIAFWKALQQEMLKTPELARTEQAISEHTLIESVSGALAEQKEGRPASTIATQVAGEEGRRGKIQLQLRPPIMPLRFPLTDRSGALGAMPDTTSLPPAAGLSYRLRHLKKRSVVALLILVVLVLGLPSGMLAWQAQHAHLGSSAASDSMSLARQATAKSEAEAEATLAAQARAQATAGITSSIGAGKVLYSDPLTTHSNGWIDDGYQCFFTPAGYHVQTARSHEFAWCYSSQQSFSNIVISVQAQLSRGDIYGLIFRLSPSSQQFYVLELNSQGEYRFVLATGSNPINWLTLIDWTHSSAIQAGYHSDNTVLVIASGTNFRFYLNKQLVVTSYTNAAYSSGLIGFMVGGDINGGSEAIFSNILVFQK